jgi:hypothetical protein
MSELVFALIFPSTEGTLKTKLFCFQYKERGRPFFSSIFFWRAKKIDPLRGAENTRKIILYYQ